MDAHNEGQAPATDDQDLANVLAGIGQQPHEDGQAPAGDGLQFEETPAPAPSAPPADEHAEGEEKTEEHAEAAPAEAEKAEEPEVELPQLETILPNPVTSSTSTSAASPELEGIKKDALTELRPLVDKLNLPADEKFDTLLLIIRSTDDQSLIADAHEAAKAIEDETRRAAALLDVIKEIDYFGSQK